FDRDWKKIEDFVGSKTVIQIRSHAQKYFLKVQKNGTLAHVPPPRPKRKAAHPYPQKASKNADIGPKGILNVSSPSTSGLGSSSRTFSGSEIVAKQPPVLHVVPDFSEVYNFIGSVFDPETRLDHVAKLKEMDPINFETVLLLMRNLTFNLSNPEFESARKVLSSHEVNTELPSVTTGKSPSSPHAFGIQYMKTLQHYAESPESVARARYLLSCKSSRSPPILWFALRDRVLTGTLSYTYWYSESVARSR
ncbi:hypothetical protein IGI04_003870, partial [Brassica rapa subsp. trilocularis]